MKILALLILASLAIATAFLIAFIWAVCSGQYEDTCTPPLRLLLDDAPLPQPKTDISTKADQEKP